MLVIFVSSLSGFLLGFVAFTYGCSVGTEPCEPRTTYSVLSLPPAPLPEIVPAAPAPAMTWVGGHWHWDSLRYVWVPGYWETPPPGRRWFAPRVTESSQGRYRYHVAGFFCDPSVRKP